MRCPFCDAEKESLKVIDSRTCEGGRAIRRRRQCLHCNKRFTTYERIEENVRITVVKKDGSRVPFDREKVLTGLQRACYKRPVELAELQRVVDEVEEEVHRTYDKEVPSSAIGQLVTERLRRIDQVAYVRFASVYKRFKTLEELVDEAQAILDAKRYEVPGQGRLFLEPPPRAGVAEPAPANGGGAAAAAVTAAAAAAAAAGSPRPRRRAKAAPPPAEPLAAPLATPLATPQQT